MTISELYFEIIEFEGENIFESVLKKWVIENCYKYYLLGLSTKIKTDKVSLSIDDKFELYALSRVLDILTLQFQPQKITKDSYLVEPKLLLSEFIEFIKVLGLDISTPKYFHTFDCEIIEAEPGDVDFKIIEYNFPAIKLKNLMIKRAGVRILLNPDLFNLNLVNNSKIYWAFKRKNRNHEDLSHGWGSNSQWRTSFRLDIETNSSYIYNHDGDLSLNNLSNKLQNELKIQNLELQDAIEITKYGHFIKSSKTDIDFFPYNFKYEEKKLITHK